MGDRLLGDLALPSFGRGVALLGRLLDVEHGQQDGCRGWHRATGPSCGATRRPDGGCAAPGVG